MEIKRLISKFDHERQMKKKTSPSVLEIENFVNSLEKEDGKLWQHKSEEKALHLFHEASLRVPAYKDFLKKNKVNPLKIKTIEDFHTQVPLTDKQNYINAYSLQEKCWDGDLHQSTLIASSSGTTGESQLWPRSVYQEIESSITHELIFKTFFKVQDISTALVICFPLGVYVSGVATLLPSWLVASKGYKISCITTGNNKKEVLKLINKIQKSFEQIILIGHPFFLKDVIETGIKEGVNWKEKKLKLMFCSGSFGESWREYIMEKTGIKDADDIISTYGCTEMLLIGHETPLSIFIRKSAKQNMKIANLFGDTKMIPNLFQYNPLMRYIECVDQELVFTTSSGLPLIRFNLHDAGKVVSYSQFEEQIDSIIPDWKEKVKDGQDYSLWKLPFVALNGRSDQTVKFYAANIYPEHIQIALNLKVFFKELTGRFVMTKSQNRNKDESLEINIELRQFQSPNKKLKSILERQILSTLIKINSEYVDAVKQHPGKNLKPKIKLWEYNHRKYFTPGLKPKFII